MIIVGPNEDQAKEFLNELTALLVKYHVQIDASLYQFEDKGELRFSQHQGWTIEVQGWINSDMVVFPAPTPVV